MYLPRRKSRSEKRCCPVCAGTGKVKVKGNGGTKTITCPRCGGSGEIRV